MSDIHLSHAVRSNLLSLQNTATMMSKTQERLATGLKVNSAMDNPTNFFTASSLKSRASDLGLLMDSVSNAVQTLAAADKGISAITKLVESAQATARQALQTAATVSQPGAATAGTVTAGAFSTLNVAEAGSVGTPAALTGGAFSAVDVSAVASGGTPATITGSGFAALDVSGAGTADTPAVITGGSYTAIDLTTTNSFTMEISVDGASPALALTIDASSVSDYNSANSGNEITDPDTITGEQLAALINFEAGNGAGFTASFDNGSLVFTSASKGDAASLQISAVGGNQAAATGVVTGASATTGADGDPASAITFDVMVNGGSGQTVTIDAAAVAAHNLAVPSANFDPAALTADNVAVLINSQLGASVASVENGEIVFSATRVGSNPTIEIANFNSAGTPGTIGFGNGDDTGTASIAGDTISFDLTINGGNAQTITIDAEAVTAYNDTLEQGVTPLDAESLSAADIAALINHQAGVDVASVNDQGRIVLSSSSTEDNPTIEVANYSASVSSGSTGIGNGDNEGEAGVAGESVAFSISINGGNAQAITISSATVDDYNSANLGADLDASALTAENVAAMINFQLGNNSSVASVNEDGNLVFTSGTTGANSSVAITGLSDTSGDGSTGIANASNTGTAAGEATTVPNPKRAELVDQYNELLQQINDLAKDASFNGVNLLNGDELQVIFNEDSSSRLDIAGVTFDFTGLGLAELGDTAFDSNPSINDILGDLKGAIETLRTQASKFGSNLQVVETRQNFTKDMINVLETGAANLTLADTNEEAANLLALQTRQQLASTALSMASQADQAVLRLF